MKGEGNFTPSQDFVSWKHGRTINKVDFFLSFKDVIDEGRNVVENVKEINLK
jgi:hypothetical protein